MTPPHTRGTSDPPERGLSPVIGTMALIAITVALAALVGAMMLDFDRGLEEPAPHAYFEVESHLAGADNGGVPYVKIIHEAGKIGNGSTIYVEDSDGNQVAWKEVWTGGPEVDSPEYVHIDGKGSDCALNEVRKGEVYRIVKHHESGNQQVLKTVEIETQPPTTPGPFTCP